MADKDSLSELEKIRFEHLHKNMNDLLKEIRFLDKTILIFSGIVWAWIVQYDMAKHFSGVVYFAPLVISVLFSYKTHGLLKEFESESNKYKKYCPSNETAEKTVKPLMGKFNKFYYGIILGINGLVGFVVFCSKTPCN